MKRSLAGSDLIGMTWSRRKTRSAVLQADPCSWNDDARAEAHIVRLDEGNHHPAGVGGGKINRAARLRRAMAQLAGATAIDKPSEVCKIGRIEQSLPRGCHRGRIANKMIDIGERQFRRLDRK